MDADPEGAGGGGGATLTVGPASKGMVRGLVEEGGSEIALDFEPDEAEEIADELRAAAERVRAGGARGAARPDAAQQGVRPRR